MIDGVMRCFYCSVILCDYCFIVMVDCGKKLKNIIEDWCFIVEFIFLFEIRVCVLNDVVI